MLNVISVDHKPELICESLAEKAVFSILAWEGERSTGVRPK